MPRMRPPGRVRQPQGNPSIPDTGDVVVDLSRDRPPPEVKVYGKPNPGENPPTIDRSVPVDAAGNPEPEPTIQTHVPTETGDDPYDAYEQMKKTSLRAKSRREVSLESQNAQLQAWGAQQANEAAAARHEVTKSNLDTVSSALAQAESEAASAEQAYADAWAKGDGLGVAKAQRAMTDAQYRINTLRAGKDELEETVRQPVRPQAPPVVANPNVEAVLARMPQLSEKEKNWVRDHPDSIEGDNVARLRVAYADSQRRGLVRGTPEYFAFLNDRLDYNDDDPGGGQGNNGGDMEDEPPPRAAAPPRQNGGGALRVSAPPSRTGMGQGSLRPGQIVLTEAERQIARSSGISEVEYARGKQRLIEQKRQGLYPSG